MKTRHKYCPECEGDGFNYVEHVERRKCLTCGGSGIIRISKKDIAAVAKLQTTINEVSKRIVADTK